MQSSAAECSGSGLLVLVTRSLNCELLATDADNSLIIGTIYNTNIYCFQYFSLNPLAESQQHGDHCFTGKSLQMPYNNFLV